MKKRFIALAWIAGFFVMCGVISWLFVSGSVVKITAAVILAASMFTIEIILVKRMKKEKEVNSPMATGPEPVKRQKPFIYVSGIKIRGDKIKVLTTLEEN